MFDFSKIDTTLEDVKLISSIAKRGMEGNEDSLNFMSVTMDITAVHHHNPLNLIEWFNSEGTNFYHDFYGILNNINRGNGKLENCFLPRFVIHRDNIRIYFDDLSSVCGKCHGDECSILQEATWPEQADGEFVDYGDEKFNCNKNNCPLKME